MSKVSAVSLFEWFLLSGGWSDVVPFLSLVWCVGLSVGRCCGGVCC